MIQKPVAGRPALITIEWQANSRWAILVAALAVMSFVNLSRVSEFLYFQF